MDDGEGTENSDYEEENIESESETTDDEEVEVNCDTEESSGLFKINANNGKSPYIISNGTASIAFTSGAFHVFLPHHPTHTGCFAIPAQVIQQSLRTK